MNTVSLCKEVGYDNVFAFIYSPRVGTPAAKMIDNVTYEEKSKRFRELQKVNEEIIEKKSKNMIGKIYEVLVDNISKKSDEFLTGYNECNKVINFRGSVSLIGKLVKVRILESHTYSLIGELVDE